MTDLFESRNGFALYEAKERLIARATLKNGVYPLTLQIIHPDFDLIGAHSWRSGLSRRKHGFVFNERLFVCELGAPVGSQIRSAGRVGSTGREDGERNGEYD